MRDPVSVLMEPELAEQTDDQEYINRKTKQQRIKIGGRLRCAQEELV